MATGMEVLPLKILLLGPHDTGKSTVAVQVLCKWGGLGPQEVQKLQKQVETRKLTQALLLQAFQTGQRHYKSPKYEIRIISSPRCSFPKQSQAAYLLLLIPAPPGEFGSSWRIIKQQVSFACRLPMQQKYIMVCVNKMDATDPPFDGQQYKSIVSKVSAHLQELGRSPSDVVFLPISAVRGDNMQGASREMPWFEGWEMREAAGGTLRGMTLRQFLEAIINYRLDSYSAQGAWSPQEEKTLLLAWKALAGPTSSIAPCPHALSVALLCAGTRRSPEQCRSKANSLLNGYIAARLQGRQIPSSFPEELQAILDHEATQCQLQMEKMKPRLQGPTGSQASAPLEEEDPAAPTRPSPLQDLLLAMEALREEEGGPGVRSERPHGNQKGKGDLLAWPRCLGLPSGQRDQDPGCLITGLEIESCKRVAWPLRGQTELEAEEAAFLEGYRCVVYRTAYFAVKQKKTETAAGAQPKLSVVKPVLAVPPLRPPVAQRHALLPTPEVDQLGLFPGPPSAFRIPPPLLPAEGPGLAFPKGPASASPPLQVPQMPLSCDPAGSTNALPWQYQQAQVYAPLGHWPSSHSWEPAPLGVEASPAQLGLPSAAAAVATWFTRGAPEPGPQVSPPEGPSELPPAADSPGPPSSGTSMSPPQHEAPPDCCLGLSAATLLSSLARLDSEKDWQVACPPGTPLQRLSPPLSADSGAPPSPQLQGLLSSSGPPSPPWLQLNPGDSCQQQPPSTPSWHSAPFAPLPSQGAPKPQVPGATFSAAS